MFEYLKADLQRLSPNRKASLRTLLAGLLSQGFQAITVFRLFNWIHRRGFPGQPIRFLCERFIEITTGISIPACCNIGAGLRIHHFGGIILHPTAVLGENCTLYHGVTIGDRGGEGGAAVIGNNVLLGAGSKIIGELTIGDNVIVGANTVVTKDVPADTVAVGSPARYLPRKDDAPESTPQSVVDDPEPVRVMDLRGTYKGGGGPDKTILNSAVLHDRQRVDVLVTYIRQPDDHEFQIPQMAAERGIRYTDLIDGSALDLKCLFRLRRLLRKNRIQVLHTRDDKTSLYGCLLRLLVPGLRLLHTCHSHAEYGRKNFTSTKSWYKFRLRKWLMIRLMKLHHRPMLTISGNTRQRLIRGGMWPEDVAVLANGIDIDYWRREGVEPVLRKELGIAPDQLLIGTVARITYDKDLPTFFRVARQVVERHPEARFVVVGDGYGDELTQARAEVAAMGLEEMIFFTGHRTDLKEVYASFDLFLMTSRTEGMPNTLLEAMALELPAVSTDVGGIPELAAEGETAILAGVGDVSGLAAGVCQLVADSELRCRFAASARHRIEERFDFAARVRAMEDIYCWFVDQGAERPLALLADEV